MHMFRLNSPDSRFILIRLGIIVGVLILISVILAFGMKMINKSIGIARVLNFPSVLYPEPASFVHNYSRFLPTC
jgi:hypothetical protein